LKGFEIKWDDVAQAPYAINKQEKITGTYDDERSIAIKTQYAVDHHLGGIMFWQLMDDNFGMGCWISCTRINSRNSQRNCCCLEFSPTT
jgi:GH18 family chitinase